MKPLFTSNDWSVKTLEETWKVIDKIAKEKFQLDYFDPEFQIVTAEQMIDAYTSAGLPIMYRHWSFGKDFIQIDKAYKKGKQGLAYEMIINTDPAITYIMENNNMVMQALVMCHAVCGHSAFFKNNYMYKEYTDPQGILTYLKFAREYVAECEQKYGEELVSDTLDACHALKWQSIDRYSRQESLTTELKRKKFEQLEEYRQTLFGGDFTKKEDIKEVDAMIDRLKHENVTLPEDNLLYFLEKHSPTLLTWQRELCRIVRKVAHYFYPNVNTKMMNEGYASFIHHTLMTDLEEQGYITEGQYLEFLHNHTSVCCQFEQQDWNVYSIGYAMFKDIKRICENPDDEDRKWFPDIAGTDWKETTKEIVANYRDESFILQFLSPKIIRHYKMFNVFDDAMEDHYVISHTQSDEDIYKIRENLAKRFDFNYIFPYVYVKGVDWDGDRSLTLGHKEIDGRELDRDKAVEVLDKVDYLWGFEVDLETE